MKEKKDILLIFLLFKPASVKSKSSDIEKKIVCLFIEKYSLIEKESIRPVNPNDIIKIKFILSIEDHKFCINFIFWIFLFLLIC